MTTKHTFSEDLTAEENTVLRFKPIQLVHMYAKCAAQELLATSNIERQRLNKLTEHARQMLVPFVNDEDTWYLGIEGLVEMYKNIQREGISENTEKWVNNLSANIEQELTM